jgi:hypothetical protein
LLTPSVLITMMNAPDAHVAASAMIMEIAMHALARSGIPTLSLALAHKGNSLIQKVCLRKRGGGR